MEAQECAAENDRDRCAAQSWLHGLTRLVPRSRTAVRVVDEFEVLNRAEMLAYVRARVAEFASAMPFGQQDIDDIRLAIGEAAGNALQHGASSDLCRMIVRLENHGSYLKIVISDKGCGFKPARRATDSEDPLSENGRGIRCMRTVMDQVKFRRTRPGTSVEMIKRTKPPTS
jgi:anti-sigma regulatory factor (Ser/Thr protein kinase)